MSNHTTVRLTTRSSWMDFRDALEEGSDFDTSGALKGRNERYGAESFGRIPREYRASLMDAEYVVYSYVTPIAWRTQGQWVTPDVKYSVTTSRHQSRIFTAIEQLTQFS